MKLDELNSKLKTSWNNGSLVKIILLVVAVAVSSFPFFSIQSKLRESLGDQPKLILGANLMIVFLIFIIGFSLFKTRRKD